MKHLFLLIAISIFLLSLFFSCSKDQTDESGAVQNTAEQLNPNGDSELALLMRKMYEEAEVLKKQLAEGENLSVELNHNNILTAKATEPETVALESYKSFAQVHIQNMEMLQHANPSKRITLYESMVNNCINCHKEVCPGPLKRIEKLKLPAKEI